MASVTSLDKDLRNMRLSKYTPQAANEVRDWIEEVLGERLAGGDLLDALKDGVALCKLVNLVVPSPGVKYKISPMPFVQMENISHFLRACQLPPLSLPPHDVFLTVDLYEAKDPAQVLQCLSSFSRAANGLQPSRFPRSIGPKGKTNSMSPTQTGASDKGRGRGFSNAGESRSPALAGMSPTLTGSSNSSKPSANGLPASPRTGGVSSWSKKADEVNTAPAWNIHQYGYMGGASQGNQGISFGARRQITTASPMVPSLAEKEKRRQEEEERLKIQAEEAEYKRQTEREAEEERDRIAEEQRWEDETRKRREKELLEAQEESRRWEEEDKKWKAEEERRIQEEKETELRAERDHQAKRIISDNRLRGQFLSQYQAEQQARLPKHEHSAESERIRQLERELEEARQRERQYEQERQKSLLREPQSSPLLTTATPAAQATDTDDNDGGWQDDERDYLRREWGRQNATTSPTALSTSIPSAFSKPPPPQPPRPLPDAPSTSHAPTAAAATTATSSRPLPDPKKTYTPYRPPVAATPVTAAATNSNNNNNNSIASPSPPPSTGTKAKTTTPATTMPKRTTSSLLEREMERERERQREWEAAQTETRQAAASKNHDGHADGAAAGFGPRGETWDVHQYGWLGGGSQNRGDQGIGIGAGRRQILGPRAPPRGG